MTGKGIDPPLDPGRYAAVASAASLAAAGRRPPAEAMGLAMPEGLAAERELWTYASRLSRLPYDERAVVPDRFRTGLAQPGDDGATSADRSTKPR